jgi:hypothetical protein
MAAPPSSSLQALRGQDRKDLALQGALQVFSPAGATERPDMPDAVVTAVRRIAAIAAAFAPYPDQLDNRLRTALVDRGAACPS